MAGEIIKSFAAPATGTFGLTFDGKYLWVVSYDTNQISCIDFTLIGAELG